jgi:nucleoside-diphosphate-sugar epimerase
VSRVLVTGASGFVGAPLVETLLADGHEVHALTTGPRKPDERGIHWHRGDMLDPSIAPVVDEVRAERLVHLAWDVSHGCFWTALENAEWVEASLRLLRAFAHAGGRRAVMVGSCAEYAWGGDQQLDERNSAIDPGSLYGVCKDALRRIASAYADEAGLELAWGRLFFLYGPREQPERLVPAVIRSLISGVRVATTAGTQVRDFMHVQDAAGALAAVLQSDLTGPVNIGSGQGTSVAEVLDILGAVTGAGDLIDRGARPALGSEPARIVANVGRLAGEVGYRPAISLRDGLAASVDWWRERQGISSAGLSPTGS